MRMDATEQGIADQRVPYWQGNNADSSLSDFCQDLIASRQNISPRRLDAPGPGAAALDLLFRAAAAAPDHGLLTPWRFLIINTDKRAELGEVFARALIDRDPGASLEQIETSREKAQRAPFLLVVVAKLGQTEPDIPVLERMVSVGAAVQNLLLAAHSMGFGSSLTSGQAMKTSQMRNFLCLSPHEEAVCFVNIGTVVKRKAPRLRPDWREFVSTL